MSTSNWEHGSIKLPPAELVKLRQALADLETVKQASIYEHTQIFWKGLTAKQKASEEEFIKAFTAYKEANVVVVREGYGRDYWESKQSTLPEGLWVAASRSLRRDGKPARAKKEDINFPTNKTLVFRTDMDAASIRFDRDTSSVTWDVPSNNGAVERARATVQAHTFFRGLENVRWSRGTGGYFSGNDEMHDDPDEWDGGDADYTTGAFGPIGADYYPLTAFEYRTTNGTLVRRSDFPANKRVAAEELALHKRLKSAARAAAKPAGGGPGRVGAGNGARSGEWTAKGQSTPDVRL